MTRAVSITLSVASLAFAQCRYPCWSEIAADKFTYESYESAPVPTAAPPFEFSFPVPPQPKGGNKEGCDARENPNVDIYRYHPETQTWTGPLDGPVYTNPSYLERSPLSSGWKGIAAQVSFEGKVDEALGHTLIESIFFHEERCYRASTEFGFSHYIKGQPSDKQIWFYYEVNANCQPKGKCRVHASGEPLVEQRVNVPIPIPAKPNSRGGADWLYEAYLIDGGAKWHIRIVDPHSHKEQTKPIDHDVEEFFKKIVADYAEQGASGYVTATATRDGVQVYTKDPPVMNIVKIYAGK